jgi:hypothetical protein
MAKTKRKNSKTQKQKKSRKIITKKTRNKPKAKTAKPKSKKPVIRNRAILCFMGFYSFYYTFRKGINGYPKPRYEYFEGSKSMLFPDAYDINKCLDFWYQASKKKEIPDTALRSCREFANKKIDDIKAIPCFAKHSRNTYIHEQQTAVKEWLRICQN